MANNVVLKTIALTEALQPLAVTSQVITATLSAPPTNSGSVTLRTPDGSEVDFQPGEWHILHRVDLAHLQAKGQTGDELSIVGGTW